MMVEIQPIRVEVEREVDGRILASVPELPGVMANSASHDEAVRKVKAIALQVLADMIESGEDVPASSLKKQVGSHRSCSVQVGRISHSAFTIAKRLGRPRWQR